MRTTKRANFWENWTARIQRLADDVEDALTRDFAPVKFFSNGQRVTPDKNTSEVRHFLNMLENLRDFAEQQNSYAQQEVRDSQEAEISFEAWSLGLCPHLMKEFELNPHYRILGDAGDIRTWQQIAHFKGTSEIAPDDTISAVETWRTLRQKAV